MLQRPGERLRGASRSANAITIEAAPRCDPVRCVRQRGVVESRLFLLSRCERSVAPLPIASFMRTVYPPNTTRRSERS